MWCGEWGGFLDFDFFEESKKVEVITSLRFFLEVDLKVTVFLILSLIKSGSGCGREILKSVTDLD